MSDNLNLKMNRNKYSNLIVFIIFKLIKNLPFRTNEKFCKFILNLIIIIVLTSGQNSML